MGKFTKGPWKVVLVDYNLNNMQDISIQHGEDGEHICDTVYVDEDASLIACAPEMYEMLESKLDLIRCGIGANYSGDPKENPKYLEVVELLKRARGE